MASVYEIVTGKIIEKLDRGIIPWRKPWNSNPAVNWVTQKPYRGLNQMLLDPGEYATWNQIKKAKGKVKKGAKSEIVTFYKLFELDDQYDENTGEKKKIPLLRYYRVFNVQDCEGIEPKQQEPETYRHNPIEEAEKIIEGYQDAPLITFAPNRAFYVPIDDTVSIPHKEDFQNIEDYYNTFFHELIHSTGHEKRLNRKSITSLASFRSHEYSREELVAEIGAAMLCGQVGIEKETLENTVAYVQSWLSALKNDKQMVIYAASQAQKAADHILGIPS